MGYLTCVLAFSVFLITVAYMHSPITPSFSENCLGVVLFLQRTLMQPVDLTTSPHEATEMSAMDSPDEFEDFCTELRIKTKTVHDKSDKTVNLKLAVVLTDFSLWSEGLCNFFYVFQAIENGMDLQRSHPHIQPLAEVLLADGVRRTEAFDKDLCYFAGADWKTRLKPSPVCDEYCARVAQLSQESPTILIAYIHSMYLALLAGGQIIKRLVQKSLGTSGDVGFAVFDFDSVGRNEARALIMEAVNKMALTRAQKDAIIEEKVRVFGMNNDIVNSIEPKLQNYTRLIKLLIALLSLILLILYLAYRLIF